MGPTAWRIAVATLVPMGALAPSAASGLRHVPPLTHAAVAIMHCGNNGCTEASTLTMGANGGIGATMTDNIPASATEASVTIAPICQAAADRRTARAACADGSFTDMLDSFVGDLPQLARLTPGKPETRLMGCVFLAFAAKVQLSGVLPVRAEQGVNITAAVFLTCVELMAAEAGSTVHPGADAVPGASTAAQRCARLAQTVRTRFTKSGGKVVAQAVSSPKTSTGRMPVSISCKHVGPSLVITLKPTKRGQKLPKVIGPTVGIGYVNPGPLPAAVKTTFKVN